MKIFSDKVLKIAENVWSLKTREKGLCDRDFYIYRMVTLLSYLSGNFTHNNDTGEKPSSRRNMLLRTFSGSTPVLAPCLRQTLDPIQVVLESSSVLLVSWMEIT